MSLRKKVEGNELDLSLNQLTEVPVKELAAANNATCLDLSCNRIISLPVEFSTLTHLVKIDLSKNSLIELPHNFGNLLNLEELDLYDNQISQLPISFCRLKNLRWLDLKNNPLEPKLKAVAGDCFDLKECKECAKKVVLYMQSLQSMQEREKQKMLKALREREALVEAEKEKELEERRRLRRIAKEKRKAESRATREAILLNDQGQSDLKNEKGENCSSGKQQAKSSANSDYSCIKSFFYSVLYSCFILFLGLSYGVYYAGIVTTDDVILAIENFASSLKFNLTEILKSIFHNFPKFREVFLKCVYYYMETVTNIVTQIEQTISLYV